MPPRKADALIPLQDLDLQIHKLTVQEFDVKMEKIQTQAMTARKNEEYQAFQKEISGLKADKSRVEDGLLDLMMQSEEKGKLEKLRQEEVKQAEDEYNVAKKKLEAEMAVDDRDIESH